MPRISSLELQLARVAVLREKEQMFLYPGASQEAAERLMERCPACGSTACDKEYSFVGDEIIHRNKQTENLKKNESE